MDEFSQLSYLVRHAPVDITCGDRSLVWMQDHWYRKDKAIEGADQFVDPAFVQDRFNEALEWLVELFWKREHGQPYLFKMTEATLPQEEKASIMKAVVRDIDVGASERWCDFELYFVDEMKELIGTEIMVKQSPIDDGWFQMYKGSTMEWRFHRSWLSFTK